MLDGFKRRLVVDPSKYFRLLLLSFAVVSDDDDDSSMKIPLQAWVICFDPLLLRQLRIQPGGTQ